MAEKTTGRRLVSWADTRAGQSIRELSGLPAGEVGRCVYVSGSGTRLSEVRADRRTVRPRRRPPLLPCYSPSQTYVFLRSLSASHSRAHRLLPTFSPNPTAVCSSCTKMASPAPASPPPQTSSAGSPSGFLKVRPFPSAACPPFVVSTDPLVRLSDAGCRRLRGCRQAQLGHRLQRCGPSPFFKAPASRRVRVADHRNRRAGALWRLQLVSSLMGRLQTRSDSCRQEARARAATEWESWL